MVLTLIDDTHFEGGKNLNVGQREGDDKVLADIINDNQAQVNTNQTALALNTTHRSSDGTNHADVVSNTAALAARVVVTRFTYDFAVDAGATGTIVLGGTTPILDNAILVYAYLDIRTAVVSVGNNGTMALQFQSAGDLLATVDADTLAGVDVLLIPGATPLAIKATTARGVSLVIATNNFTAGVFDVYLHTIQGLA